MNTDEIRDNEFQEVLSDITNKTNASTNNQKKPPPRVLHRRILPTPKAVTPEVESPPVACPPPANRHVYTKRELFPLLEAIVDNRIRAKTICYFFSKGYIIVSQKRIMKMLTAFRNKTLLLDTAWHDKGGRPPLVNEDDLQVIKKKVVQKKGKGFELDDVEFAITEIHN